MKTPIRFDSAAPSQRTQSYWWSANQPPGLYLLPSPRHLSESGAAPKGSDTSCIGPWLVSREKNNDVEGKR